MRINTCKTRSHVNIYTVAANFLVALYVSFLDTQLMTQIMIHQFTYLRIKALLSFMVNFSVLHFMDYS